MTRPATVPRSVQLAVARFFKAVRLFPGDAFHDERRVRERLQSLAAARFVRAFPATHGVGGPINWYKLTTEGFRVLRLAWGPRRFTSPLAIRGDQTLTSSTSLGRIETI